MNAHWTERSTKDFVYRIASDFALQIENKMEAETINQSGLARRLGVTDGRVSQVLKNPGNLTIKKIVEYARALGMKVAIVAYEDSDPENNNGPINSQIFSECWTNSGRPTDFFSLRESATIIRNTIPSIDYLEHPRNLYEGGRVPLDTQLFDLVWQAEQGTTNSKSVTGAP